MKHSLTIDYHRVLFFGSVIINQLPYFEKIYDCIDTVGPRELVLPRPTGTPIASIKAGYNRSAILYQDGRAFIFGEGVGDHESTVNY